MFSQCWRCVHPYDDGWRIAGIRNAVWSHGWKEEGVARLQEIAVAFDCQRDLSVYDITDLVAFMLSQPVAPRARLNMKQGCLQRRFRTKGNQELSFDAIDSVTSKSHAAEHGPLALAHDDSRGRRFVAQQFGNRQAQSFGKAMECIERGNGLSIFDLGEKAFRATGNCGEIR